MRKIKKRLKMSKFEKLLYTLALFLLVISPVSIVFSKATLANINYEVEKQKQKIEEQQKVIKMINNVKRKQEAMIACIIPELQYGDYETRRKIIEILASKAI